VTITKVATSDLTVVRAALKSSNSRMKGDIKLQNRRASPGNSKEITWQLGRNLTVTILYRLSKLKFTFSREQD